MHLIPINPLQFNAIGFRSNSPPWPGAYIRFANKHSEEFAFVCVNGGIDRAGDARYFALARAGTEDRDELNSDDRAELQPGSFPQGQIRFRDGKKIDFALLPN